MKNLTLVHSRVTISTNPVKSFDVLKEDIFVTMDINNAFLIWSVKTGKFEVLHELRLAKEMTWYGILDNRIFLTFSNGDQELLEWNDSAGQLYLVQFVKEFDHEKAINSIDTSSTRKLAVTCSDDGFAKIWDYRRQLVRQIRFPYKLSFACFLNCEGDVLLMYNNSISVLKFSMYSQKNLNSYPTEGLLKTLFTPVEFLIKITGNDIMREFTNAERVGEIPSLKTEFPGKSPQNQVMEKKMEGDKSRKGSKFSAGFNRADKP